MGTNGFNSNTLLLGAVIFFPSASMTLNMHSKAPASVESTMK